MINEIVTKRNEKIAEKVIKNIQKRHMEGYYAASKEEALELAMSMIPEDATVGFGGGISLDQIGLRQAVREQRKCIDRDTAKDMEERQALQRQALLSDVFLMGTNAISEEGEMVNIDGGGNRVAALIYGPKSVIVIAGMNKLVKTLDDAMSRARNVASPINAQRFPGESPCRKTGSCGDCCSEGCICNQIVITRGCLPPGRIKIILVNDEIGF